MLGVRLTDNRSKYYYQSPKSMHLFLSMGDVLQTINTHGQI